MIDGYLGFGEREAAISIGARPRLAAAGRGWRGMVFKLT
jgi:hypothetical protein